MNQMNQMCGQVYNIFHSPISLYENTLDHSHIMMQAILEGGAIAVGMTVPPSFLAWSGVGNDGIWDEQPGEAEGENHQVTLFGWGEEKGQKYWWGKNSWGSKWPLLKGQGLFKIVRGKDVCSIETGYVNWLTADPPGTPPSASLSLTKHVADNGHGFCSDLVVDPSMLIEKRFKMKHACVKVECGKQQSQFGCMVTFKGCSKTKITVVTLVSEVDFELAPGGISNFLNGRIYENGEKEFEATTACIQNVVEE